MREIHMIMLDVIGINSKNTIFSTGSLGSCRMAAKKHKKADEAWRATEDS